MHWLGGGHSWRCRELEQSAGGSRTHHFWLKVRRGMDSAWLKSRNVAVYWGIGFCRFGIRLVVGRSTSGYVCTSEAEVAVSKCKTLGSFWALSCNYVNDICWLR